MKTSKPDAPLFLFTGYNEGVEDYVIGSYLFDPTYCKVTKRWYHHYIVRDDGFRMPVLPETVKKYLPDKLVTHDYSVILKRINEKRDALGFTYSYLAETTEISYNTIQRCLTDKKNMRLYTMFDILDTLNMEFHLR